MILSVTITVALQIELCSGQFYGDYKVKLEKWNTGRVYFAEDNGFSISNFGPVCVGTRDEALIGSNGNTFGKVVCNELGFGKDAAKFVGSKADYYQFMDSSDIGDGDECVPEYVIAGARCKCKKDNCTIRRNCRIRNYRVDGGSCLKGQSDMFIHCQATSMPEVGSWSPWREMPVCSPVDYFRQRFRTCKSNDPANMVGYCQGPWLELIPCGRCLKDIPYDNNYNYDDANTIDYYTYPYSDEVPRSRVPKRRDHPRPTYTDDVCQCMLTTLHPVSVIQHVSRPEHNMELTCSSDILLTNLRTFRGYRSKFNGSYKQIPYDINEHGIWIKGNTLMLWTNNVFGHGYSRRAGWVVIVNNKIRWWNPSSEWCPSDTWEHIRSRSQRPFSIENVDTLSLY